MRIHLKTSRAETIVPFNYQPMLTGALHKWIGENVIHDKLSLYSFSWLNGGKATKNGLFFNQGGSFFISAHDPNLIKKIISGIRKNPEITAGIEVLEVLIQDDPSFGVEQRFFCASPILIKRVIEGEEKHFGYNQPESNNLLTETLQNKLRLAGLEENGISVMFDVRYPNLKTKVIYYNNIGNKTNLCPVIIKGSHEQVLFAWNVGLGNSTGIGFGAIK